MAVHVPPSRSPKTKAEPDPPRRAAAPRPRGLGAAAQLEAIGRTLTGAPVQRRAAPDKAGGRPAGRVASLLQPATKAPNRTGLPDSLKAGVEALSGLAMDDVRVHRNSPEPAKLGALAYAQGTDIHLGPGQEQHLPHEAWHVVQQKQGRVKATAQMKGVAINEEGQLEAEADRMGAAAARDASGPLAAPGGLARSIGRQALQLQKAGLSGRDAKDDDKPKSLAEEVVWTKSFKDSKTIPGWGLEITVAVDASASFEHKGLTAAAEALTKAEIKKDESAVGMKLNVTGTEIVDLLKGQWANGTFDEMLDDKVSSSISTNVGNFNFETTVTPIPFSIATTVKPKNDLVVELDKGFRAVVSATFTVKMVKKGIPPSTLEPLPYVSPVPTYNVTINPPKFHAGAWIPAAAISIFGLILIGLLFAL